MDKSELTRLKELAEKAMPGPWELDETPTDIATYYEIYSTDWMVADCEKDGASAAYIAAANPATILAMIAEIERIQNENQYLKDWAQIDIVASKSAQAFEEELCIMMGIDPDVPEKARRSEILANVAALEKENTRLKIEVHDLDSSSAEMAKDLRELEKQGDWLANELALDSLFHSDMPCGKDCNPCDFACRKDVWREAARKAVS